MASIPLTTTRPPISIDRRIAAVYVALLLGALPLWPFAWHLGLHMLGAAFLIGNAVVMAIWLSVAGYAGSDDARRRAARAVVMGDVLFTVPGVVLLLTNGLAMVFERYGGAAAFTSVPFLAIGLVLLSATGIVWALGLVPVQLRMLRLAAAPLLDRAGFRAALVRWSILGTVATVLPIAAVVVMRVKPTF